jgi:hypothetical protein
MTVRSVGRLLMDSPADDPRLIPFSAGAPDHLGVSGLHLPHTPRPGAVTMTRTTSR